MDRSVIFDRIYHWLKPGGKLYCLDPRHNLQRAISITKKYLLRYRKNKTDRLMATHDFISKIELRSLYRRSGFVNIEIEAYDFPLARWLVLNNRNRQFAIEGIMGQIPVVEHFGRFLYSSAVKRPH